MRSFSVVSLLSSVIIDRLCRVSNNAKSHAENAG